MRVRAILNDKTRILLVTVGWAVNVAFIILQALYQRLQQPLAPIEVALIIGVSVFAGIILIDADSIVYSYIGVLLISTATVYASLTLPATVGVIKPASLRSILLEGAIGITTRVVLLYLLLPCLIGGIFGGILGERFIGISAGTQRPKK